MMTVAHDSPTGHVTLRLGFPLGRPIYTQTFAAASRFDTINPVISWADLQRMWQGEALTYTSIALISDTLPALQQILGSPGGLIEPHETVTEVVDSAWDDRTTLVLIPFDQLCHGWLCWRSMDKTRWRMPSYFDASRYPLTATVINC